MIEFDRTLDYVGVVRVHKYVLVHVSVHVSVYVLATEMSVCARMYWSVIRTYRHVVMCRRTALVSAYWPVLAVAGLRNLTVTSRE